MNGTQPEASEVERTVEKVENKPAYVPLLLWQGAAPIYVPYADYEDIASLMRGERGLMRDSSEPEVRRVLDIGANVGEFAVFCRLRFPYAWVDCVETDVERAAVCDTNAPAGTQTFLRDDACISRLNAGYYDLVRVGNAHFSGPADKIKMLFVDGAHAGAGKLVELGFDMVATGMRKKHQPWSWWRRSA